MPLKAFTVSRMKIITKFFELLLSGSFNIFPLLLNTTVRLFIVRKFKHLQHCASLFLLQSSADETILPFEQEA